MISTGTAFLALATLLVLAGQWWLLHQQNRIASAQLAAEYSNRWRAIQPDWGKALVSINPIDRTVDIEADVRLRYLMEFESHREIEQRVADRLVMSKKLEQLALVGSAFRATQQPFTGRFARDFEAALEENFNLWMPLFSEKELAASYLSEHSFSRKAVLRYLAEVAALILQGDLKASHAYAILGGDVAGRGGSLRRMMNCEADWLSIHPGLDSRVRSLVDLMWAEAARIGELNTQPTADAVAAHKRDSGTGKMIRRRIRIHTWRLSTDSVLARGLRILKLRRVLIHAERPKHTIQNLTEYQPFGGGPRELREGTEEVPTGDNSPWLDMGLGARGPRVSWLQMMMAVDGRDELSEIGREAIFTLVLLQKQRQDGELIDEEE